MVTDFNELVDLCSAELHDRGYSLEYIEKVRDEWNDLRQWMNKRGFSEFSEEIGDHYSDEKLGFHLLPPGATQKQKIRLRAIRLLISYQLKGDFEFRSPSRTLYFQGDIGGICEEYLLYCEIVLHLAAATLNNKKFYLLQFNSYFHEKELPLNQISMDEMNQFFEYQDYTPASRHNANEVLRIFLRYAFDNRYTEKDLSVYILSDSYRKNCTLPTTYEEEEISKMLSAVERGSAIGKRDYLVLLLASEYGMRARDITRLRFEDIDWDNNVICITTSKTDAVTEFPLLSSVGNAIIDYLKNGRPKSDAPEIIVSLENANKGKPLSPRTIHSIVTRYLRAAKIENIENKKHGPHALRHSLATNLLKRNVAMPIISTVMSHQTTETTKTYISVDYDKLKLCALPMPELHSPLYRKENRHG